MVELLDLSDSKHREQYSNLITRLKQKRPFDSLSFFESFSNGFNNLSCIKIQNEHNFFLLVGYIKSIIGFEQYFDFVSPYGYSGPIIFDITDVEFEKYCWAQVEKILLERNVVSCFLRLSLGTELNGFPGIIKETMKNIKGEIISEEEQWSNFEHKVRKNVNKAKRSELVFEIFTDETTSAQHIKDFCDIYIDTMNRNSAKDNYYYSVEAFERFIRECNDMCALAFIYKDKKPVSTELLLLSDTIIYSFLGGTLEEAFEFRPNDLLKFEVINWARKNNIKYFVMGGGYGANDGIYKYKKSFFPTGEVDYRTARWILNQRIYDEILHHNIQLNIDSLDKYEGKDFFPEYNKFNN